MKIATWNIERLKHKNLLSEINEKCMAIEADILVLTETDSRLQLDYKYRYCTPLPGEKNGIIYQPTENRVSIFTNYPCVCQYPTYDEHTSLCVELKTGVGNILVYGTIIGVLGNRHSSYISNLINQLEDFRKLSKLSDRFCICGDFNCSFGDNYYFTKYARQEILKTFSENGIELLTQMQPECIEHIAVSNSLVGDSNIIVEEWNCDRLLSDHKGISALFDC